MKKQLRFIGFLAFLLLFISASCASQTQQEINQESYLEVIQRGAGESLGSVYATAAVSEDRETGIISGDTGKYGLVKNIPVSRVTTGKRPERNQQEQKYEVPQDAAGKAYANAVYEIIQQVKALGGNAVNEVISDVIRNYDPETGIETIEVSVSAEAVLLLK